jgi:Isocitrate/isopropylmalate dehydrogenase
MLSGGVVPDEQVACLPAVPVDEARFAQMLEQLPEQCIALDAVDAENVRRMAFGHVERLARRTRMHAHDGLAHVGVLAAKLVGDHDPGPSARSAPRGFERLQQAYRKIKIDLVRIDNFSSSFPRAARNYRFAATTNLFGDILPDQASGLAGSVGLAPSLNAGHDHAMAQAVHGTAPDIAGKGVANPSALILSTALLLRWFYQRSGRAACRDAAHLIESAVRKTIESGATTLDLGGKLTTGEFARAVVRGMGR